MLSGVESSRVWRAQRQGGVSEPEKAVFAATERLLERMPIGDLSVGEIVKAAGISRPTFYYYFTSKHAVIAALVVDLSDKLGEPVGGDNEPATHDWESLNQELARQWHEHANVLRAAVEHWHEVAELTAVWRESTAQTASLIAGMIDAHRAAGIARPGYDSGRLALAVVRGIQQAWYHAETADAPDVGQLVNASEPVFVMLSATLYGE